MSLPASLVARWRQALIDNVDAGGQPGYLALYSVPLASDGTPPEQPPLVRIRLAMPVGVVDAVGVALSVTEYSQVVATGDVIAARLEDSTGAWCGNYTAGLATDDPVPQLVLPAIKFYAGAFFRLVGSRIDIGLPAL